ncbi:hypothetical protein Taro_049911, partial [Colocasia esculenta]|nr:hypothetical protein [Colocasia esculenta]
LLQLAGVGNLCLLTFFLFFLPSSSFRALPCPAAAAVDGTSRVGGKAREGGGGRRRREGAAASSDPKMSSGPSGFHNAPVTRAFVLVSAALTVLFGIQGRSTAIGLSYQDIFKKFHLWKLITSVFGFSSTPELIFGLYLLYYFRVFERQIGSNKYSVSYFPQNFSSLMEYSLCIWVFILFSLIVSTLLGVSALAFLGDLAPNVLASGPYGVIFSSFVPFYFDIPVSSRFRIFGIRFTDKSFIYLAGLQLLLSSWKRSLLPGICGVIAGLLYRLNIFGIRRIKANYSSALRASASEPPEDSIAMLVSMGFDMNSARQALVQARNDINIATNILLEAQSR